MKQQDPDSRHLQYHLGLLISMIKVRRAARYRVEKLHYAQRIEVLRNEIDHHFHELRGFGNAELIMARFTAYSPHYRSRLSLSELVSLLPTFRQHLQGEDTEKLSSFLRNNAERLGFSREDLEIEVTLFDLHMRRLYEDGRTSSKGCLAFPRKGEIVPIKKAKNENSWIEDFVQEVGRYGGPTG